MPPGSPPSQRYAASAAMLAALLSPAAADAHRKADATARPQIASVRCDPGTPVADGCPEGELLALRGERLAQVARVDFMGAPGRADNRHAHPRSRSAHRILIQVPDRARTGRLRAVSLAGHTSRLGPRLLIPSSAPQAGQEAGDGVFPVRGRYDFGTGANAFGGGRSHQGQDIFAACGTPVAAARPGRVVAARTGGNEGNYAVIEAPDGGQQAYLHMLQPPSVGKGDQVLAGAQIGKVGQTGNASGCHLHFELWTAPGRFTGGTPYDPRPDLDRWAESG